MNQIDELNKLENQIKETQVLLETNNNSNLKINQLKKTQTIFGLLALLFLISSLWLYFFYAKLTNKNNIVSNNNFVQIHKDSLNIYKSFYLNKLDNNAKVLTNDLSSEKIIYNVQLGAFQNFKITSESLMNLKEFTKDGYNKFSVGNYKTYVEAVTLKDSLIKIGFKDCFIIAQTFGNQINIEVALTLSEETQYLL